LASASSILVVHESDDERTAKRFVAILCFMDFYALFVSFGVTLWNTNGDFWDGPFSVNLYAEWTRITLFACTTLLYLCGRSLWLGGRRQSLWHIMGILGVSAILLIDGIAATLLTMNTGSWNTQLTGASPTSMATAVGAGLQAASFHLPLLSALIVLRLATSGRWRRHDRALWVYCAAAYCVAWIVMECFEQTPIQMAFGPAVADVLSISGAQHAALIVTSALLLATAVLLLRASVVARSTALMMATLSACAVVANWFVLAWLINIATNALLYRVPFSTPVERPYSWTKHDFIWLLVLSAHYVPPWLLIAVYAWRRPMRRPLDDGTSFPRRYCANCQYNLYGNKTDRCPECGQTLNAPNP